MTHYPYIKSTDKRVDLGIGNVYSTIRTSTGTPLHDSLIRTVKVRISESTSVLVVQIAGPQCILTYNVL